MRIAQRLAFGGRQLPERVVSSVDGANAQEALDAGLVFADRGLEEIAPAVSPTSDEGDGLVIFAGGSPVQDVVDVAGVGLEKSREAAEELPHEVLRVLLGVREQHVVGVHDGGEEVALLAGLPLAILALFRLDQRRRCIGRDHRAALERVLPHGVDDGGSARATRFFHVGLPVYVALEPEWDHFRAR